MAVAPLLKRRLPARVFGAFDASSPSDFQAMKAAGLTHALIDIRWDDGQPNGPLTALDPTYLASSLQRIHDARAAGLRVQVMVAFHYTPAWVDTNGTAIPKFIQQDGISWSEGTSLGRNVRDWYWSATGRAYLADFVTKVIQAFPKSEVDSMRTGTGWYGENNMPPSPNLATFYWWGFGSAPQNGTDLADGMSRCPYPGYTPFSGDSVKDHAWTEWYLDSAVGTLDWLIKLHRDAGWLRDLFILQPGFGLRSNMTEGSSDWKIQACVASDWARQMAVYASQPYTHMHCTWIDGIHPYAADLTIDSNTASWYKLLQLDISEGRQARASGENTRTNWNYLDEDRVFQLDALAQGYRDMWFLTYPSLAAATSGVVDLPHTAANIAHLLNPAVSVPTVLPPTSVVTPLVYLTSGAGVTTSSSAVTGWVDQSGNGNGPVAPVGTARPTLSTGGPNGKPFVSFNGTTNMLTLPAAAYDLATYTIFVVARTHGPGGFMGKIGGVSGSSLRKLELGMSASTGQFYTRAGSDSAYDEYFTPTSLQGAWHVYSTTMRSGSDFDMNVDGANQSRTTAFSPTPFNTADLVLGREGSTGGFSQVDIAELLIIPSAVGQDVRQQVETYFRLAYRLF